MPIRNKPSLDAEPIFFFAGGLLNYLYNGILANLNMSKI